MRGEFMAFLKQYGVIGLAIAVIIGGKANALVTALGDGGLMPIVTFFVPGGAWRTATVDVGSVHFLLGPGLGGGGDLGTGRLVGFGVSKEGLTATTMGEKVA